MRLGKILGKVMPAVALVAAAGLSGCDNVNVSFDGDDGVPLAELDMSGDPPTGVVLAGPDSVTVSSGDEFDIEVSGSDAAQERMRFALEDDALVIHRADGDWSDNDTASVAVTLPSVDALVVAGSGTLATDALTGDASLVMAGSGTIDASSVDVTSLDVVITGSGTIKAQGSTDDLSLNIVGSGDAEMEDLQAGDAEANIVGSGDAVFSSDGRVDANFVGSGDVRVIGSARCEANTIGSGRLVCENDTAETDEATENEDA